MEIKLSATFVALATSVERMYSQGSLAGAEVAGMLFRIYCYTSSTSWFNRTRLLTLSRLLDSEIPNLQSYLWKMRQHT